MTPPGAKAEGRIDRWLSRPWAPFAGLFAGLLVALPSFRLGFFADDDILLAFLEKRAPFSPPWYDLYRFAPGGRAGTLAAIDRGQLPWWASPDIRLHLVRPLTSALFTLDHALFLHAPAGYHLHSIAWWALLLVAVRALFRRVLPEPTAWLGVLLFAVADGHFFPVAWISARHCLVSAACVVLGLVAVVRAREEAWAPGRWLGPLAMVVGLSGGETALGGLAFWVCYEVAGPARPAGWAMRARRAAVPVLIGIAYLALYAADEGGARNSGGYVDPTSPAAFVVAASKRYPALLAAAFLAVPAELAAVLSIAPFVAMAIVGGAGAWLLWRACGPWLAPSERAAIRWMLPGALLAMLGAVGGFPGSRQLIVANLAWTALFAILVRHGFHAAGPGAALRRAGTAFVVLVHLALAPLSVLVNGANAVRMKGLVTKGAAEPPLSDAPPDTRMFAVAASDPMAFVYPLAHMIREGRVKAGQCFSLLSAAKENVRVTRTGDATLLIEPAAPLLRGTFEQLYRSDIPFHAGDEIASCGATVRVLATDADGKPTRIEARLGESLDEPRVRIVTWEAGSLTTSHLAVGESDAIAWSPGPMQLF